MPIIYADGGRIDVTVPAASVNTRTLLANWLRDQLVFVGWSASGASGSWTLTSALTTQGITGLGCRVILDASLGSGYLHVKMANKDGSGLQSNHLYVAPNYNYRLIANRHQFFLMADPADPGGFLAGGVLYVPTQFSGTTAAVWGCCNSLSPTDSTIRTSFRNRLIAGTGDTATTGRGNCYWNYNNAVFSTDGTASISDFYISALQILTPGGGSRLASIFRYSDNSIFACEPFVAYSLTGGAGPGNPARVVGQIWDGMVLKTGVLADSSLTGYGHTWRNITVNNPDDASYHSGTLFIRVS